MTRVAGIVLCGGESKRMGRPKPWLPFAGELLLPRVVRLLSDAVSPVVVVSAAGQSLPALPADVSVVHDAREGLGPLHGLAAGLAAIRDRADAAYVTGCDVPFLRPALVRRVIDSLGDHAICVVDADGHAQPLTAVYRVDVLDAMRPLLDRANAGPSDLFKLVPTRHISAESLSDVDPDLASLRNLNTPEEYDQALRDALAQALENQD